jgi:hypothetical protein
MSSEIEAALIFVAPPAGQVPPTGDAEMLNYGVCCHRATRDEAIQHCKDLNEGTNNKYNYSLANIPNDAWKNLVTEILRDDCNAEMCWIYAWQGNTYSPHPPYPVLHANGTITTVDNPDQKLPFAIQVSSRLFRTKGPVIIDGPLTVTGELTVNGTLTANGATNLFGKLQKIATIYTTLNEEDEKKFEMGYTVLTDGFVIGALWVGGIAKMARIRIESEGVPFNVGGNNTIDNKWRQFIYPVRKGKFTVSCFLATGNSTASFDGGFYWIPIGIETGLLDTVTADDKPLEDDTTREPAESEGELLP